VKVKVSSRDAHIHRLVMGMLLSCERKMTGESSDFLKKSNH